MKNRLLFALFMGKTRREWRLREIWWDTFYPMNK